MIVYRPRAPLDRVVERFWWSYRAEASTTYEHMLPSGRLQLVLALHEQRIGWSATLRDAPCFWTAGIVHGPQSSFFVAGPKPRGTVVGVSFWPGAAGAILGVPVSALADRHVTLEELWGRRGRELHERLLDARSAEDAFGVLEAALLARLRTPLLMHPAVANAVREMSVDVLQRKDIATIRHEAGYSAKHFVALCRAALGLTPKQYLRIQRFGLVLRERAAGGANSRLADIAGAMGYSDQSHMTREFREFAGISPSEYRPPSSTSPHHHVVAVDRIERPVKNIQDGVGARGV